MTSFNKNEISIHSACDVDAALLIDFYKKAYPKRINSLALNWKWLNRSGFYQNKIPLVLVYKNEVIAHSGMIPFNISIGGDTKTSAWFMDFKVLPEFQKYGLGSVLTKEWMKFSDCCVTFCNDKSIGVFKKFGWIESFDTYMHLNFMLPFNHPGFVRKLPGFLRKLLNVIAYPFLYIVYSKLAYTAGKWQLKQLTEESFKDFFLLYAGAEKAVGNAVGPVRDEEYARWRVLNSPNRINYFIYRAGAFSAVVSVHNNHGDYIDVLWASDSNDKGEIARMISTLGLYGLKKNISFIRFYTSKKELSGYIRKKTLSTVRHPRFAYFSSDESLLQKLKTANWDLELIDSDFEYFI